MRTAEFAAPTATARTSERPGGTVAAGRRADGWRRRYVRTTLLCDAAAAFIATLLVHPFLGALAPTLLTLLVPPAWLTLIALHQGYDTRRLGSGPHEYASVGRAGLTFAGVVAVAGYHVDPEVTRWLLLVAAPTLIGSGLLCRRLQRRSLRRAWAAGRRRTRVLAVGHPRQIRSLRRHLRDPGLHGVEVIGACLPTSAGRGGGAVPVPVFGTFPQVAEAAVDADADAVVVLPSPEWEGVALRRLSWQLEQNGIDLIVASPLFDVGLARLYLYSAGSSTLLHVAHPCRRGPRQLIKEIFDRVGALLLLVLLAPIMIIAAILIKFAPSGRGPVLFRQMRVGRDGVEFPMYKFRTMHPDAEARLAELHQRNDHDGVLFKMRNDPRVTPLGRWLRRYSLDELPQLFNVVRGEMSLVGPRPPLPQEVARYPADMHRRLVVKPGLTGLWQVSGRADLPWQEAIRLDLRYVENWSLTLDVAILLRTAAAVVRPTGAY